ncbi:MAG: glycosyltransferase family 39 protein [Anaerolineae bacterium]|nr:glycosyltransferase family 39 protein [Anaerolineae bacterium]
MTSPFRRFLSIGLIVLAAVVLLTYQPALRLNFYGDDYSFVELAGRSSLVQYLAFYFDPRLQTGWYRPIQGMVFGIEWILFGGNPLGYHAVNVLVHLVNCLLLFALVARVTCRWRAALLSALIYAGLPLISVAVFWPGDADFLLTCFYLSALLCWIVYLQQRARRFFVATFIFFLLALLTKEFGVTLPLVLLLADRLLLRERATFFALVRRYVPFIAIYAIYLPLEFYIQSRSVLTNMYGYRIAEHIILNFLRYLAALAFPWGLPEPFDFIWLAFVILGLGYFLLARRDTRVIFLVLTAILAFLPVTPFPWFFTRYLYLAVMASAILVAFLFDQAARRAPRFALGVSLVLALIVGSNAFGVANAAVEFAELGRQTRVPFRDIAQRHATFPTDTYLYFINPPTITSQLSGMFFLRYGGGVRVASNESGNQRANLRDHAHAYVVWFDEERRTREMPVEKSIAAEMRPAPPLDFDAPIRLEGYELARANVTREQAIVLILYWRAQSRIEEEYSITTTLVDARGNHVAQSRHLLRALTPDSLIVDAIVLPVANVTPGEYRLEIEVNALTRVPILLAPIKVIE